MMLNVKRFIIFILLKCARKESAGLSVNICKNLKPKRLVSKSNYIEIWYGPSRDFARDWVVAVSNCTIELFWGRYRFFYWLLRSCKGNWVKVRPSKHSHSALRLNTAPDYGQL